MASLQDQDHDKLNFSFAGCGFIGMYHFGVAACLKRYVPHLLNKISGASAGALAAAFIAADIPLSLGTGMWVDTCISTRKKVIGALSPSSDVAGIIRAHLESCVPPNAHLKVNGKVHISMTRVRDLKNIVVSQFESRAEFIDALLCTCSIPFFVGLIPPLFRGERYVDGGFSDNIPIQDEHTVTVNPFSGESDICPRDGPSVSPWVITAYNNTSWEFSMKNVVRLGYTVVPPKPEVLREICRQGYLDGLRFLQRRGVLECQTCLESPLTTARMIEDEEELWSKTDVKCLECEDIDTESLPTELRAVFEEAISANSPSSDGVRAQVAKILSLTTLPLALTADLVYAAALKLSSTISLPRFPPSDLLQDSVTSQYLKLPHV